MKEIKKTFKWFTVTKYEEEQEYLRKEHQAGWKLVKVSFPGFYTFEKCEPEDVIYQLDYNQEREKGMAEYIQMFRDCGWEYICDFVGYSYFRKAASQMREDETIFSDDSSRLEMIGRVFKGRMVPLLIIFAAIICPQLIVNSMHSSGFGRGLFIAYCCLFFLYVLIFIQWGVMYWKLKNKK